MTRPELPKLPVTHVLDALAKSLGETPNLVLVAPPGAGKTTLVPLALLDAPWRRGENKPKRIIMLEPRRMAARAAASRMAQLLGEKAGDTVGYRVRFDTKVGPQTVIEVITEGVFTRMLSRDPGLEDVAVVIFDEFHERSLDGDLSLALALDLQQGLREDLRLIAMSATLDGAAVANLMGAPVLESEGRSFPVTISYRERQPRDVLEQAMADCIIDALAQQDGDILVFLPGQREIERTTQTLDTRAKSLANHSATVHRLYGALPPTTQDAALRSAPAGTRKIVLSSAIAETSLTIEGVTTVIDSGLARQPVFEPATGLTRLQTVRASRASITQRAGRAGRVKPGHAIRLWREQQTAALPAFDVPEIANADLAPLLLDLANWGVFNVAELQWLDVPPAPAVREAQMLLVKMGALEAETHADQLTIKSLTAHGRAMATLGLPPRFAHMVLQAAGFGGANATRAALLALLVQERGVGGAGVDLTGRADRISRAPKGRDATLLKQARKIAKGAMGDDQSDMVLNDGTLLAFAFPDRIARRAGQNASGNIRFKMANGRAAEIDATQSLAAQEFLTVVDMVGQAGSARIVSAAALNRSDIDDHFADQIEDHVETRFSTGDKRMESIATTRLGALTLERPRPIAVTDEAALSGLLNALESHGLSLLPWAKEDIRLRGRMALLHARLGAPWPAMDDAHLLSTKDEWLVPFMQGARSFDQLDQGQLSHGLMLLAPHTDLREIERLLPAQFPAPLGYNLPIDYSQSDNKRQSGFDGDMRPVLRARPQELFGLDVHPTIMDGQWALDVELLSPAGRPIQITRDLPGFWRGSWADVRADLRGRYPKHPWPEDALTAPPTNRIKPRKK